MPSPTIRGLFANQIDRRIEEVIKVDQADEAIIREEIDEYCTTASIRRHYTEILDRYWETPQKPHDGVGIWVSGFFGSGKSNFAKILGLAIENRLIVGEGAALRFGSRTGDQKIEVLLRNIAEKVPTEAVIFDVSTDRGIRSGNQTLTEIMYRLFLRKLGYAGDLDLADLEITLEAEGRLEAYKAAYQDHFQKDWDKEKGKVAFAIQQASVVMHQIDPKTFTTPDSWKESAKDRADITPGLLAERCKELMARRRPGKSLVFVIDEVGQFVARDIQKMLDLQAIVQSLGRVGRGKLWLVVTSQEKLTELVGGLDDKRVELARLMDRFPLQVHLEPSDISEVTSRRVLYKNAEAQSQLRDIFTQSRGRLTGNTRLTADIRLPELSAESFVDLYPLLPYQVDLIIQIVSGLRLQGGASKHVGGANRTIIKLAQQLLIHPDVNLAEQPVGTLATIDRMYDLVSGNISSEIRGKIDAIRDKVSHPLAQSVAKAVCLLQFVKSIHRTAENIAAVLHPSVEADSRLPEVKEALDDLVKAHQVREGDDGYRIPTPAEDDWETSRGKLAPKPADSHRIHQEIISLLWQPQPSFNLMNTKLFNAGLTLNGRPIVDGELAVNLWLAEVGKEFDDRIAELRGRSQAEIKNIYWIAGLDSSIPRETDEYFRSREMITARERSAQTRDEASLLSEERKRLAKHQDELKRLLKKALLTGSVFFQGNDRSPDETLADIGKAVQKILSVALPQVFDRYDEAAAKIQKKDLDIILTTENLRGLTPVYTDLGLVREEGGKPVFNVEQPPLSEVYSKIENRTSYGETASGRYLTDEFGKEPFGWDFEVVRLLVLCLLRSGKIEAISKGQIIDSALSLEARNTFTNNNFFRSCSFQPKVGIDFAKLVEANEHYREVFGKEISSLEQVIVADTIRESVTARESDVQEVHTTLVHNRLPGADVLQSALDSMRAIRQGKQEHAIASFNNSYREIKEAIKRAGELNQELTPPRLADLDRARKAIDVQWPILAKESDVDGVLASAAEELRDIIVRETFYREFATIDQTASKIEAEYQKRHKQAADERVGAYQQALQTLHSTPGWEVLTEDQQPRIAEPLATRATTAVDTSIDLLRADTQACPSRLQKAIEDMLRIVDGNRIVRVAVTSYFSGGIETEEQLDAALDGLREECEKLIGEGKKVLIQ